MNKLGVIGLGVVLGLVLGCGLVYAFDYYVELAYQLSTEDRDYNVGSRINNERLFIGTDGD